MKGVEVSGAVRPLYGSLGIKGLMRVKVLSQMARSLQHMGSVSGTLLQ